MIARSGERDAYPDPHHVRLVRGELLQAVSARAAVLHAGCESFGFGWTGVLRQRRDVLGLSPQDLSQSPIRAVAQCRARRLLTAARQSLLDLPRAFSSALGAGLLRVGTGLGDLLFVAVLAVVRREYMGVAVLLVAEHFDGVCVSGLGDLDSDTLWPDAVGNHHALTRQTIGRLVSSDGAV